MDNAYVSGIALAGSAIGTSASFATTWLALLARLIVADRSRSLQDKQFGGNSRWLEERLRVGGSCAMPHWKRKIPMNCRRSFRNLKRPSNTKSRSVVISERL